MMTLQLTEQEMQAVLDALAAQPYNKVAALINKVVEQVRVQQQPPPPPQDDE